MTIEAHFDIPFVGTLLLREKQIPQNYRPLIAVHKWSERGPGSLFRALTLAEFGDVRLVDLYFTGDDDPGRNVSAQAYAPPALRTRTHLHAKRADDGANHRQICLILCDDVRLGCLAHTDEKCPG